MKIGREGDSMKSLLVFRLVLASGVLVAPAAHAGLIVSAPVDVIGNLPAARFTMAGYGTRPYKDWGNEPFVAVNSLNTNDVFISSFSFSTATSSSGDANVFYSTNGGANWTSQFSVPPPTSGVTIPNDWTFAYDSSGSLHGAILGASNIYQGTTANPTSAAAWSYTAGGTPINTAASIGHADQPWIALQGGKVFIAYDDDHLNKGERVAVSNDNGATFTIDNPINNGPQPNSANPNSPNPGTRVAVDARGILYSIFGAGPSISPGVYNVTYYLNRSRDGGVTWDFNPDSLVGGIIIDSGVSTQACHRPDQGGTCTQTSNNWFAGVNNLLGNITAIAPDKTGSHVYVLIGKQDAMGTDRIYLAAYQSVGTGLIKSSEIVISPAGERAALPAITVLDDGTIMMTYETYGADGKVHIHIASSVDFGTSIASDIKEYSFTPLTLAQVNPNSPNADREFGDYDFLMSIGDTAYGTFAGLGDVDAGGINTTGLIDPFFFTATDVPEPASWSLVLTGLAGAMLWRRRKISV
jgi:PEP-CTERM motif